MTFKPRSKIQDPETKSITAIKLQALTSEYADLEIHSFRDPRSLGYIKVFSDADMGGFSKASLELVPFASAAQSSSDSGTSTYARFHGSISIELPPDRSEIQRSGYAAFRTLEPRMTLFGRKFIDVDPYRYLALRVKSDGAKYFVNVQTDSVVVTDLHQHRLYAKRIGEWETVYIPFNEFVRTNYGQLIEPQGEMIKRKVTTVGIGLIDRVPGPFEICIDRIWATTKIEDDDFTASPPRDRVGELD
ncbi:hypothetical protein RUND412_008730 [Rhizina undulata]